MRTIHHHAMLSTSTRARRCRPCKYTQLHIRFLVVCLGCVRVCVCVARILSVRAQKHKEVFKCICPTQANMHTSHTLLAHVPAQPRSKRGVHAPQFYVGAYTYTTHAHMCSMYVRVSRASEYSFIIIHCLCRGDWLLYRECARRYFTCMYRRVHSCPWFVRECLCA